MSEILKEKHFNPKAHILTLLGNELIKSPIMAIYELVKNSYDADAENVSVRFRDIEDLSKAVIIIEDDGIGMTSEILEDVWLEPGSDFRKPINKETGLRQIIKSSVFGRIPMGEKGVGRFAVHKLGSEIFLVTRPLLIKFKENRSEILSSELANYEIHLYINWKDFNQSKHLSEVPIKWKIKKDLNEFRFKEKSGTYIRLSGLKETWTKGMAKDLKGQVISMLSPKIKENSFKINLNFNNDWLADFPSVNSILNDAPYKITALIDSEYNLNFEYEFKLKNKIEIGQRKILNDPNYNKSIKGQIRQFYRKYLENKEFDIETIEEMLEEFDDKELPIGNIFFEFYSYDLDATSMRDYTDDSKVVREMLKLHSGVKIFKGDLRVYDYGEPNNDWLGLDLERVQNKEWFSNNQNIGYVYLDPESSNGLIEKTNREGFISNEVYDLFYIILKQILTDFKTTRSVDRAKWLRFNKKGSINSFDNRITNFRAIIEDTDFTDIEKKKKLIEEAEKLEERYEEDKKTLLIPAGVGMTASVALHEIEKLVPRMQETVKPILIDKKIISEQVEELRQYTNGILSVLRKGGDKEISIEECLKISFSNYKLKMKVRKINYEISIDKSVDIIKSDKRYFITMIMNIIDNSIYWLDTIYNDNKGIYVKSFKEDNSTCLLFVDNGPGFKDEINDIVRPFFSRKSDGIGIGLYLIDTIMMHYGKVDIVKDHEKLDELGVPFNYRGAALVLKFNKLK
ncbi:sensor histidine kinase [Flavobacterium sp. F-380]|uniref:Sensor histidine kinase n=1 Tax=Flavobacterium kayseriense TaxID=2764714 RepID=A0ABR7JAR8_9FLAO|nr:ATP-binding protein [Flavobacterium kayseriense]MBC5842628.1 sensor histidine kinase [Flavobacterium kayseriense]MBC5849158.1 sensor histidine kinase [Flavobacterium kayseriense]